MARTFVKKTITPEVVSTFLDGRNPQERIVNFEYNYQDDFIKVYIGMNQIENVFL